MTPLRAKPIVFELIHKSLAGLSSSEIMEALNYRFNRVTIYRSLVKLQEENCIQKVVNPQGIVKYIHWNCAPDVPQVRFCCKSCGKIVPFEVEKQIFTLPENYIIEEMNLTVSGKCPSCEKE